MLSIKDPFGGSLTLKLPFDRDEPEARQVHHHHHHHRAENQPQRGVQRCQNPQALMLASMMSSFVDGLMGGQCAHQGPMMSCRNPCFGGQPMPNGGQQTSFAMVGIFSSGVRNFVGC